MTDCVYFLLYLALGKLSLMLLINYYYINVMQNLFLDTSHMTFKDIRIVVVFFVEKSILYAKIISKNVVLKVSFKETTGLSFVQFHSSHRY